MSSSWTHPSTYTRTQSPAFPMTRASVPGSMVPSLPPSGVTASVADRATSTRCSAPLQFPAPDGEAVRAVASCDVADGDAAGDSEGTAGLEGAGEVDGAGGLDRAAAGERGDWRGAAGACRSASAPVSIGASRDRRRTHPVRFTCSQPPRVPIFSSSVPCLSCAITVPLGSARRFSPSAGVTERSNPSRVVGLTELRMIQPLSVTWTHAPCTLPTLTVAASVSVPRAPALVAR